MKKIIPELMVDDMEASIYFYEEILGFEVIAKVPETGKATWASLKNGEAEIMLYAREELEKEIPMIKGRETGGGAVLYLRVEDIEKLFDEVKTKVTVVKQLETTDYGVKEFAILDNSGYVVMVGE